MDETTVLLTTAQISVTFVGFATLASILGSRSGDDWKLDAFRLRNMLVYSLSVTAFSLYPLVPLRLGWPPSRLWQVCSIVAVFWCTAVFIDVLMRLWALSGAQGFSQPSAIIHTILAIATIVVLSANVLAWIGALPPDTREAFTTAAFPIYLIAIYLLLTSSAFSFIRIIYSLMLVNARASLRRR